MYVYIFCFRRFNKNVTMVKNTKLGEQIYLHVDAIRKRVVLKNIVKWIELDICIYYITKHLNKKQSKRILYCG